jgi:hypothetical protein
MVDPDSVMERSLQREGKALLMQRIMEELNAELEAHMAEMDRRVVERLEQILFDAHAHRSWVGSAGWGKTMRGYRYTTGRLVFYDEIKPDLDDGANIEYLKSLVKEEPVPQPPRRCPRPQRLERKGRDAERRAQNRRERRQQPARVPKR